MGLIGVKSKWVCDLCTTEAFSPSVSKPEKWGFVELYVSWSPNVWSTGIICKECLDKDNRIEPGERGNLASDAFKAIGRSNVKRSRS